MFIFFNMTFFPMFLIGLLGQPRRVFEYAQNLQALNDFASVSAFLLGASFLIFIANFVWSIFIKTDPVAEQPVELAGTRVADTDAGAVLQLRAHPRRPQRPVPLQRGGCSRCRRSREAGSWSASGASSAAERRRRSPSARPVSGDNTVTETSDVPLYTDNTDKPLFTETPEEREFELRAAVSSYWTGGRLLIGMYTFLFASLAFAYFYLKSNNSGSCGGPDGITAPTGIGWAIFAVVLASVLLAIYGQWRMRSGSLLDWQVSGWVAVGRHPAGHRPPDLAVHPAAVFPGIERLRILLHRLGGHEHHVLVGGRTGWRPTWRCATGSNGWSPRRGRWPRRPVPRPSSSGPTSSPVPISSVSWPSSAPCSGCSST